MQELLSRYLGDGENVHHKNGVKHDNRVENLELWKRFMPWGLEVNDRVYRRLGVHFDVQHGESFYQPMLADVVERTLSGSSPFPSRGGLTGFGAI